MTEILSFQAEFRRVTIQVAEIHEFFVFFLDKQL